MEKFNEYVMIILFSLTALIYIVANASFYIGWCIGILVMVLINMIKLEV